MSAVTATPAPKSDKEPAVFYNRKWKDSKDEIASINKAKNEHTEQLNNQMAEANKAIKYLL